MVIDRRQILTGIGAASAAGALAGPFADLAAAAPPSDGTGFTASGSAVATGAVAALTPGLSYQTIDPTAFNPLLTSTGRAVSQLTGVAVITGTGGLAAPLPLPVGSVLKEVQLSFAVTSAGPVAGVWKRPLAGQWAILNDPPAGRLLPIGAAMQTTTITLDDPVDGSSTYMLLVNLLTACNGPLGGALVGYQPPTTGGTLRLLAVPVRVYDSRPGNPPLIGTKAPLANAATRVVDAKANSSGVPAGAAAVLANITVVNTSANGFLSAFKTGVAVPTASTLNWFLPGTVAPNTTIVACDANAQISCYVPAGASADFFVDVLGYYS